MQNQHMQKKGEGGTLARSLLAVNLAIKLSGVAAGGVRRSH